MLRTSEHAAIRLSAVIFIERTTAQFGLPREKCVGRDPFLARERL